jgi:DNA-binding MarR family transcriptional regulator
MGAEEAADGGRPAPEADLAASLRIGAMRLSRRLRVERADDDLTLTQLSVLGTLARHGALPIGEIAAHENVKPPSMTRTVAYLEELGLVTRRSSTTDGRQVVVDLTDEALRVMDADRRRRDAWLAQRLAALTPAQRALLLEAAPLLDELASS